MTRFQLILFAAAGTFLSGCIYSNKAATKLLRKAEKAEPYDVIVVPGVPPENGEWTRTMKGRAYWSKYLYDKGIARNIMYSGSAVYSPYIEAEVMALYGKALGIPANHIFTETKAEHSTENIYYSYQKARQLGFKRIALASDPFQTRSLRGFVRKKVSDDVAFIPMVIDTMKLIAEGQPDPQIDITKAYVSDFVSLPDRESFWKRLRGTRGKNIDENAYSKDP